MGHNKIYEAVTTAGKLTEEHLKNLRSRGFTDHTIKDNRFFSGGKYLAKIEQQLIADFKENELLESGVMVKPREQLILSESLLDDRIIIPYLTKENEVYLLRPHKLGLSGVPVQPYQIKNIDGNHLIITEGEFKALAACQMGFPAICCPGVGSFTGQHFPKLAKFLDCYSIRKICIINDNEIKNDPRYKNYKEKPWDRYDTQYHTLNLAKLLERSGFSCLIGILPEQWMVDGKIDIDMALAQGRTVDEFKRIIEKSVTWKSYEDELPEEAQKIVKRKTKKKYVKTHVKRDFGKYVAIRWRGNEPHDEPISNFVIKIIATHWTIEGVVRMVQFINEHGDVSSIFPLDPSSMSRADGFSTFCLSKGDYIWQGNTDDLKHIWSSEFLENDSRMIIDCDHIGWIEREKMWLFSNVAFVGGEEIRPDKNGIFWMQNKGVRPISLEGSSKGLPFLNFGEIDRNEIRDKLGDCIGINQANVCLGWITAVLFMEECFKNYNCFPFLFLHGMRRSGKSTVAEWMMNFFGLMNTGKQGEGTTPVALSRYLGFYSSLPVFLDESRNTRNVRDKDSLLRNTYNRQSAGKGMKAAGRVREEVIRGTMLITGEETPNDNALFTRCIPVLVSESNRTKNHFDWFQQNRMKFSHHSLTVLQEYERNRDKFISDMSSVKDDIVGMGIDDRMAINYAAMIAGYTVGFGTDMNFRDFAVWIRENVGEVKREIDSESPMDVFLEDIGALQFKTGVVNKMIKQVEKSICIYFEGLYNLWEMDYKSRKGETPFNKKAIRDYMKDHQSYIDQHPVKLEGTLKKCMRFNANEAPEGLRCLLEEDGAVTG